MVGVKRDSRVWLVGVIMVAVLLVLSGCSAGGQPAAKQGDAGAAAVANAAPGTAPAGGEVPTVNSTDFKDFVINQTLLDGSLTKIQKAGVLKVGTSADWPYAFTDEKTGEFKGIDADILKEVVKMLNIKSFKVEVVPFDGMIPGLLDGRFDVIIDSLHQTPKRNKVVAFSTPIYYYSEWLIVKKGNPKNLHQLSDLKGHSVGAMLGSNYSDWAHEIAGVGEVKDYKSWPEEVADLQSGRVDAVIHDQPIAAASIKDHPEWTIELASGYVPKQLKNPSGYSVQTFRPGDNQLRDAWSRAITYLQDNGTMAKILQNLGLTDYNN